jgi:outer membrane protein assembly factor BamB
MGEQFSGSNTYEYHFMRQEFGNMQRILALMIGSSLLCGAALPAKAGDLWPQFRGPNASGIAVGNEPLPDEIGPEKNVLWKTALPPGHSSPVLSAEQIFLTAVKEKELLTIALDRSSGEILWQRSEPHRDFELEKLHTIGSHAQPSPATDGERLIAFFGSSGMFCYDLAGKLLWKREFGPFNNTFGAGTSPIIVDDYAIICQDHDTDSFLMALDKRTGEIVWKTDRAEFPRNYCTPIVWEVEGRKQIVVAATLRVVGYDFKTGREIWTVRGISRAVCSTPVVGEDGVLYLAGWAQGGDSDSRISIEPFDSVAPKFDTDKSGTLDVKELPSGGDVQRRYDQIDRDKSGTLTRAEYEFYRTLFDSARNVVMAIKPGAKGDATDTHVVWDYDRFVPFCASVLNYRGLIFTIKDGGILNCLDAKTGEPTKHKRIAATGSYYASPVAGDGKVYLVNSDGELTVISAEPQWKVLSEAEFGERVFATPALVDGKIYLRTTGHLWCLGK